MNNRGSIFRDPSVFIGERTEFEKRVEAQQATFDHIQRLEGFHVRLGSLSGARKRLRQKKFNVLLWGHSPHLSLGLFSPVLAAPQPDWPANAHATGFPFLSHSDGNTPELQEFLDSGELPIVFTLGSAAVGAVGDFYEQSAEAASRLGRRALLLVGRDPHNQPRRLPPGLIAVQYAPHSAVFPRCVNVHQGAQILTSCALSDRRSHG
jgi:UDP:flavonoid glycosyltransferase YjiC (YdhE family)